VKKKGKTPGEVTIRVLATLVTEPNVHSPCSNLCSEVFMWLLTKQDNAIKIIKMHVKGRRVYFYWVSTISGRQNWER